MGANDYHLVSNWRVPGTADEVYDIVADAALLPRWWPSAFLDVLQLEAGDANGIGGIVRLETRGYLPYLLRWHLQVTDARPPHGLDFRVWGDFEGDGSWSFSQDEAWTDVGYDWRVTLKKGIVRYFSFLGRPLFISNHRWAMARGEESLRLELARRQAPDEEARAAIPAPPGPVRTPTSLAAGILAGALALLLLRRRRRTSSQ